MKIGDRAVRALARTAKILITAGFILGIGTFIGVEHTSQPHFCKTCHNMIPYYESWETSTHNMAACIDCHYEPGLIETVQGKFTAVTQVAKYVTRTAGTKPWAEVSDQSCMRPGCHAKRLLEGPLQFGNVKFDHQVHILELRRGKRLRCTSCHSQIVQGNHMSVTTSTCFLCHFKASPKSEGVTDCYVCHGPPQEPIALGGFTFQHNDYLKRGVACIECHSDVTRGEGRVPLQRCRSCHGEEEHIERYDDVEFIHRNHVTDHKVECLECHEEISHSLPQGGQLAEDAGTCARCHAGSHNLQELFYAGNADPDLEPMPSRMRIARVSCEACHREFGGGAHGESAHPTTQVACAHCHGPGFLDMTETWQRSVRAAYDPLKRRIATLEGRLNRARGQENGLREAREHLFEARRRLQLIEEDGSWGAHNLRYAYRLLRLAQDDLETARGTLDPGSPPLATPIGPSFESSYGCTGACHTDVESVDTNFRGLRFIHRPHLIEAGLDCDSCHDTQRHGATIVERDDCMGCHEAGQGVACAGCHVNQQIILDGKAGFDLEETPSWMADLSCEECHSEPHEGQDRASLLQACETCHEEGYGEMVDTWQAETKSRLADLDRLTAELQNLRAAAVSGSLSRTALRDAEAQRATAEAQVELVRRDGSFGVHNTELTEMLLEAAAKRLAKAKATLNSPIP